MKRTYVESSNLESVGYDPCERVLEVKFKNGVVYQYFDVPRMTFRALMAAKSKGSHLHRYIKTNTRIKYARVT